MRLQSQRLENESELAGLQKAVSRLKYWRYVWWALILMALAAEYFILRQPV